MKSFITKSIFSGNRKKQILWFIGFYVISISAVGAFYFITHLFLAWVA
jgi:hypothetical protein